MLAKDLQNALNEQLNKELYSEYLYLSMSAYCAEKDLDGISSFFAIQAKEEHSHAMKIFSYILNRGGKIELKDIKAPKEEFKGVEDVFEKTLEHEKFITKSIDELVNLSIKNNDHSMTSFLQWYVDEQVEEESTFTKLLGKIKLVGEKGASLLMIDAELGKRQ